MHLYVIVIHAISLSITIVRALSIVAFSGQFLMPQSICLYAFAVMSLGDRDSLRSGLLLHLCEQHKTRIVNLMEKKQKQNKKYSTEWIKSNVNPHACCIRNLRERKRARERRRVNKMLAVGADRNQWLGHWWLSTMTANYVDIDSWAP